MIIIMCQVKGGVTASREAPLSYNQKVFDFKTREAAEVVCEQHRRSNRHLENRSSRARFTYWVEEVANAEAAEAKRIYI
jgi:hypothetical protein